MANRLPRRLALGVQFTPASLSETIDLVTRRMPEAPFGYVATPNAQHVVLINRHAERFGPIYHEHAWLCVCDSQIVRTLAWLAGVSLPLCTGSDLTAALFKSHLGSGDTITVIGCEDAVMEKLRRHSPGLRFQHYNPPMGFIADPAEVQRCVEFIERHPARYVFFAVGTPQGEDLASQVAARGQATGVGLCIGSSLHFVVGARRRAPRWVRRVGLEWLYRLLQEPRRLWRRVVVDSLPILPIAVPAIMRRMRPHRI